MYKLQDAVFIANQLGIKFDKFNVREFLDGINVELEHGKINPSTNITNDNLEMTAKIALAHLLEHSNYYNQKYGIRNFEQMLTQKEKSEQ